MLQKRCWRCHEIKPIDQFGKNKSLKSGINPTCKVCARELYKQRYYKNVDAARAYDKSQRLKDPEKHRESVRQHRRRNLESYKRYDAEYARTHKDKIRIKHLRREARIRSLPVAFNANDWNACLNYWQHRCIYCGREAGFCRSEMITGDHWIPLTDPKCPGTVPGNMVPACYSCNSRKQDFDPREWLLRTFGPEQAQLIENRVKAYFDWIGHRS